MDTSFGWFIPEVFENQVGLDSGKKRNPWHEVEGASASAASRAAGETIVLDVRPNGAGRVELAKRAGPGSSLLRRSDQTQFLDTMTCLPSGGRHKKGYIFGHKKVNKSDWFFSCHFWMDPVMPGSLGVESMMQCIEVFCISQGIAELAGLSGLCPRFVHDDSVSAETKWKYRGQLTPKNNEMGTEVHIKRVSIDHGRRVIVEAEAELYVDKLRVYSVSGLRIRIEPEGGRVTTPRPSFRPAAAMPSTPAIPSLPYSPAPAAIAARHGAETKTAEDNLSACQAAASTAGVSLAFADVVEIPTATELVGALDAPVGRGIVIVDAGFGGSSTQVAIELHGVLGVERCALLSFGGGAPSSIPVADKSEATLVKALAAAELAVGKPFGFVFVGSDNDDNGSLEDVNAWLLLAAKHLKSALADSPAGGSARNFFATVVRMDGSLGLRFPLSTGAVSPTSSALACLAKAERGAAFGLCKSLGLEWPRVHCRGMDLAREGGAASTAAGFARTAALAIASELRCPDSTVREVALSIGEAKRRTIVARPANMLAATTGATKLAAPTIVRELPSISASDIFLVPGGGRGITPGCIAELAARVGGGTFALLGRSQIAATDPVWADGITDVGKALDSAAMEALRAEHAAGGARPTPKRHRGLVRSVRSAREVNASIARIREASGGRANVFYLSCDVTDANAVARAVSEVQRRAGGRAVTGIIHASGVLRDKSVQNKDECDFRLVYRCKITGLRNLLASVAQSSLRHLVVFSSLAGFHGNAGQTDYSMANEVLNKIAHIVNTNASAIGIKARAFDFGPWDGGMVTDALKKHFRSHGVQIIPYDGGARLVASLLLDNAEHGQALVGNWGQPAQKFSADLATVAFTCHGLSDARFLSAHVVKGRAVLPATVALGRMATAALQLHKGHELVSIQDSRRFRGVSFCSEDQSIRLSIALKTKEATDRTGKPILKVGCRLSANEVPAYEATVILCRASTRTAARSRTTFQDAAAIVSAL